MRRSVFCYFWFCLLLCALLGTFTPGSAWSDEPPFTEEQAQAAYEEAKALQEAEQFEEAYRLILPFAEAKFPEAEHFIGYLYSNGKGVHQNYKKAAMWYQRAADQGLAISHHSLGLMHLKGRHFPLNKSEAFKHFHRAATLGDIIGAYEVGRSYFFGDGVKKSYKQAEPWLLKAAEKNDVDSQVLLSTLYRLTGQKEKRLKWLRTAAENGHRNSLLILWSGGDPWAASQLSEFEKVCETAKVFLDGLIEFDCF